MNRLQIRCFSKKSPTYLEILLIVEDKIYCGNLGIIRS
jgi:hypothetical protein